LEDLKKEWQKLAIKLKKYNKLYELGNPIIEDDYYDVLTEKLRHIESIIGPQKNSPLQSIGSIDIDSDKVEHLVPMLSLDHGFGPEGIDLFFKRFNQNKKRPFPIVAEHKVDGISVGLRYKNGKLSQVITRGSGTCGKDITKQSSQIEVPYSINIEQDLEIRGELYMDFNTFKQLNGQFSSPRNACSSIVNNKTVSNFKLKFFPHNLLGLQCSTYFQQMRKLEGFGFESIPYKLCNDKNDCLEYFKNIRDAKDSINYPIDGVVFKINDLELCNELGHHRTAPRYAFAVKFNPISYETVITSIDLQVGKSGVITPVATFKPVYIDGQCITKATLHNINELYKNNYGPGDRIKIARAGDAIPYVSEKIAEGSNKSINITNCPCCNSEVIQHNQTLKCPNGWQCKEQRIGRIEHFCSRNCLNINYVGGEVVRALVNAELIYYPFDLFRLSENSKSIATLLQLKGWNNKSINNLINSINSRRKIKLANFIFSLGIPNVGYGNSSVLSKYFESFDNIIQYYIEPDPKPITGIGQVVTSSISKFLCNPNEKWIYRYNQEDIEIIL